MTKVRKTRKAAALPPNPELRRNDDALRLKPLPSALARAFAVAAVCSQIPGGAWAAPAAGVRIPPTTLPTGPSTQGAVSGRSGYFQPGVVYGQFGAGTGVPYRIDGNVGTITQDSEAGILQWQRFDIGVDATVNVDQPSTTAVLLNKVSDGNWNHSTLIEGKLNANGQVYIYNPNGIIFGKTSQVNVNSLVATTLKIDDSRFLAGILAASTSPIFAADANATYKDANGNDVPVGTPKAVVVEGDGDNRARISSADGGKILLVAPTVTNNGVLSSPNGQVVLAAGGKVYLASPTDLNMRGLVVEVANDNIPAAGQGAATNDALGQILVGHGNATMVGLAVNQNGLISATTSVSENGSIYLHARDGAAMSESYLLTANHGGALELGKDSLTEVLPDLADTTTTAGSDFRRSVVDLSGNTVHLVGDATTGKGAQIVAPSGNVTVSAYAKASFGPTPSPGGNSHLYLDTGAGIDVSGTTGTELPMESNVIQVQLRGSELADSPLLRNSILRGQTVSVDIRKGTPLANIQGWLDLVEHGIGERTASGGSITLQSDSDVVVNRGATMNVSGGKVTYLPGHIATTRLTANGKVYDIGDATADRIYDGIIAPSSNARNYQPGYVQGYSAGRITLNAPAIVQRGNLEGGVTTGPLQRNASAASTPLGGLLLIGNPLGGTDNTKLRFLGSASLGGDTTAATDVPAFDDQNPTALQLPSALKSTTDIDISALTANGFSRLQVYADEGSIALRKPVALAAGGELTLSAGNTVDIAGNISTPGGKVAVTALSAVKVEDGVAIDVAGRWTNDSANASPARDAQGNPTTPIVVNGGSVSLTATGAGGNVARVDIGNGVSMDVSGGAWLDANGKQTAGSGGSIAFGPTVSGSRDAGVEALTVGSGLVLKGYGVVNGGKVQVSAPNVMVGARSTDPTLLGLESSWFQQGGFASYDVRAGGNLKVVGGANIQPRTDNWFARRNTSTTASGRMSDAFDVATLPLGSAVGSRKAASLSLTAASELLSGQGVLTVEKGATVETDPGGRVTLSAGSQLNVDGAVIAPGGNINLYLTPDVTLVPFLSERGIWLGSNSVLDAAGSADLLWQDSHGLTQGKLLDGGSISIGRYDGTQLLAAPGYVMVKSGARLNVSGTSATMTVKSGRSGVATSTVASAGGSIDIHAREGLLFDGTLAGAGGDGSARGGSLSLVLDRQETSTPTGYPTAPLDFVVAAHEPADGAIPQGLAPGQPISGIAGQGFVAADTINAGGFDTVRLKSAGSIDFDLAAGNVSLTAKSGLAVDAPTLAARNATTGSTVKLNAPYVQVGNSDWRYQSAALPATTGVATLQINANSTADLIGRSTLRGFGGAQFNVGGDMRLLGQVDFDLGEKAADAPPPVHALGSFTVAGTIDFTSAQLYPTSLSEFTLQATGTGSRIGFTKNGNAADIPLSAAGKLTVIADKIDQNGVVRAPLGSIDFEPGIRLTYGPGSLTSVAGSPIVPLGFVDNGRDWLYDFGNGHTINLSDPTASNYVPLPDKTILSSGSNVQLSADATLDLSGGGDLYAYEFTPGPGGSKDVLAAAGTFAVLPGFNGAVAPADFQYGQSSGLSAGDKVYLSGIPGLAAGYYTLLPAHYALLPGAYAISAMAGSKTVSATQNHQTTTGTWEVAGYFASLGGGAGGLWQGFQVTPGSLIRQESEFTDHSANAFLAGSGLTLPMDGGHVAFDVAQSLVLDGFVRLGAAIGGQRGIADISAPGIVVVSDLSQALPAEAHDGSLKLTAAELDALGADSLLLGGVRTQQSDGQRITVGAQQVIVANDAGHALTGPEIILAAASKEVVDPSTQQIVAAPAAGNGDNGAVRVKSGSSIVATGKLTHTPQAITLVNKYNPNGLGADGALLRVSNGGPVDVTRNFTRSDGTVAAAAGKFGTLDVETGVNISANGSAMYDATQTTKIASTPSLGASAALQLGANRISLGSPAPASVPGLRFDDAALAALSRLNALTLTSYSSIDVYGSVALGGSSMQNLSLKAAELQAYGSSADSSTFSAAQTLRLDGNGSAGADPQQNAAGGTLAFNAKNIEIGTSTMAARGFSQTTLNANNDVIAAGTGGGFTADGNLVVSSARITTAAGKDASFKAGNHLNLVQGNNVIGALSAPQLGGHLKFAGADITSDTTIDAMSGQVDFTASNGVSITGGTVSAAGGSQEFGSTTAYAPGGTVTLDGGTGNVTVASNATIDVSATGADAGSLSVKATSGTASLDGTLKGGSGDKTKAQGKFALDVDNVGSSAQFAALNSKLNASGFTESRKVRARHGDVVVADAGSNPDGSRIDAITAHQVSISADNGNLSVAGQINASGAKGGSIELYAAEARAGLNSGNVNLAGSARLLANATTAPASAAGSTGDGGSIVIGTSTADGSQPTIIPTTTGSDAGITIDGGAALDVSGSRAGQGGTVLLRAPRLAGNNDVAIAGFDASAIKGARSTAIEAYKVYTANTVSANADSATNLQVADASGAPAGKMYNEANSFIASQSAIMGRFANAQALALLPGLEVRSPGDLTVSVNEASTAPENRGWNLDAWRFNGQPGALTLRATDNLNVIGSISDGFTKTAGASMPDWALDTSATSSTSSWSYRLVGGADQTAANPLATVASTSKGDVTLSFARTSDASGTDNPVALLRTGTGSIDVAAGRDVVLDTLDLTKQKLLGQDFRTVDFASDVLLGASIYTAGRAADASPTTPPVNQNNGAYGSTSSTGAEFTEDGGAISVYADRNVAGPVTEQMVTNWLFRQGRVVTDSSGNTAFANATVGRGNTGPQQYTAWWSRFDYFDQGIATFGGGDITVRANTGNVVDLSASVATNGYYTAPGGIATENGGGDLTVTAGGDIRGGAFYVQKGNGSLTAQGSIVSGDTKVMDSSLSQLVALRPVLAAGDARFDLVAGKDLQIEGVFNPTLATQSYDNAIDAKSGINLASTRIYNQLSYFSTYSADSAVHLTSVSGNLVLGENANAMAAAGGSALSWLRTDDYLRLYLLQPGTLIATALNGDISFQHGFSLSPSPTGELELLAKGSVTADFPTKDTGEFSGITQPIVMIDRDPATLFAASAPTMPGLFDFQTMNGSISATGIAYHTAGDLHHDDPTGPVHVVALDGDISFKATNHTYPTTLIVPKEAEIIAGRDIIDAGFSLQNLSPTDVSIVSAGRDIVDSTTPGITNQVSHVVAGPGRVDFSAGRNFDLGNGSGVVTRGNLDNPYLPAEGAGITVTAGATADYAGFAQAYAASLADLSPDAQALLVADMKDWLKQLYPSMPTDAIDGLTVADAWGAFSNMPTAARKSVLNDLFYERLAEVSGAKGGGTLDLTAFDSVIASLFPSGSISGGDVNVFGSELKTDRGGAITVFAPGGSVYAGLVSTPPYLKKKSASELGIFTIAGGPIQSLVRTDFLVNQGRVFSLGGGDITLVSQYGNIDAGKGAKTAQAAPPPVLKTDNKGNTQVDISGSVSGSGIATLRSGESVPASNVYPIAPRGIFDAGDAGVRSTGSVKIVAETVLNASNIVAAGSVSGAKSVDTSGLGGAISAPTTPPPTKTSDFASIANSDPSAGTNLTVELLGYGGGDSQQDVTQDCQNSAAGGGDVEGKKKKCQ